MNSTEHLCGTRLAGGSRRTPRAVLGAVMGAALLALAACGETTPTQGPTASAEATDGTVVVGAGPTQQTETIAHVWARALEEAGIAAEVRRIDGGRAGYLKAVGDGEIALYPDYTGDLYMELLRNPPEGAPADAQTGNPSPAPAVPGATPTASPTAENLVDSLANMFGQGQGVTDGDIESALPDRLPESIRTLDVAPAENKRVLATTAATQARLSVNSIANLSEHCQELTFGAITGEDQAPVTAAAVEEIYGCTPGKVTEFAAQDEVVQALLAGEIDVAALVSATPAIEDNSLAVLDDNETALVPERVIPVAGAELGNKQVSEVNGISGQLDTDALVLLTRMTTSSTPYSPEEAADYWYGTVRP